MEAVFPLCVSMVYTMYMEQFGWKPRKSESEGEYDVRRLSHESNTSIEYGEKTWTTAQTVRDLMQNHLDAETEKYYQQIAERFFDEETLELFKSQEVEPEQRDQFQQFLYSLYLYSKHHGDMSEKSRQDSLTYLQSLVDELPVKGDKASALNFSEESINERLGGLVEELPKVSYQIRDIQTGENIGWVPYETLRDENKYQARHLGEFRYVIEGMKMVDHGSGYDSQLSSVFVSSKTNKKHTRGKFGEGSKMSELHLLRANASLKMRSEYNVTNTDGVEKNRVWQSRPRVSDEGRLVAEGVEVQKNGSTEAGSTVTVMFDDSKESFKHEFQENIDPRLGGLAKNIAYYHSNEIVYPNALSERFIAGVNTAGSGDVQYVQGIRVELADEAFGYRKPWYSYDFQDSSIIAGRDRNEIKSSMTEKIKSFWMGNDNPELVRELVRATLFDSSRESSSEELSFIQNTFEGDMIYFRGFGEPTEEDTIFVEKGLPVVQSIADQALIEFLHLVPGEPTVICQESSLDEDKCYYEEDSYRCVQQVKELKAFIKQNNYRVVYIKHDLNLEEFSKRNKQACEVITLSQIKSTLRESRAEMSEREPFVEGEKENAIREICDIAIARVQRFREALGLEINDPLAVSFVDPRGFGRRDSVSIGYRGLSINSLHISLKTDEERAKLQRKIELLLLDESGLGIDSLNGSQRFLDTQIARLLDESDSVIESMPSDFSHHKDPEFLIRIMGEIERLLQTDHREQKENYALYRSMIAGDLTLSEAKALLQDNREVKRLPYEIEGNVRNRFYLEKGIYSYYKYPEKVWESIDLSKETPIDQWQGLPVYKISEDTFFVPATLGPGAVISKGEGKEREYFFNDGEGVLSIGSQGVDYVYTKGHRDISLQSEGIVVRGSQRRFGEEGTYRKTLDEHKYYPQGVGQTEHRSFEPGREITAIPIEYGKDEWDNPVRVFQDIIQNHIDASPEGVKVQLQYQIERDGLRRWVSEREISGNDSITAVSFEDVGSGYAPSDIATLGASSKKSPLFAGKYGEGQKMVAAAALRNGFHLHYDSTFTNTDGDLQSWQAVTEPYVRELVIDGKEIKKSFISFAVSEVEQSKETSSRTVIQLPENADDIQREKWSQWLSIIDPREIDKVNNRGLSRYVRQIRDTDNAASYTVGGVTLLFNEPGAVYENGLRINADAEQSRKMAFGYDVPEIVTTRERNSFDARKLGYYAKHIFSHTSDPDVIKRILEKVVTSKNPYRDLHFGDLRSAHSAGAYWAEVAQNNWPGKVVYSEEKLRRDIEGNMFGEDSYDGYQRRESALQLKANLTHFDRQELINVSSEAYKSFSQFFPTAEAVVEKMQHRTVEVSDDTRRELAEIVAGATKIFKDLYNKMVLDGRSDIFRSRNIEKRLSDWSRVDSILAMPDGVGLAPVDSAFHGLASDGVILNEGLLMEGNKKKIGAVVLHEMNHILTNASDYTSGFVEVMYELAQLLLEKRGGYIKRSNPDEMQIFEDLFGTDEKENRSYGNEDD